ncbi:MAG: hypothetical protein ACRDGR_00870, partial [bacterium]
ADIDAAERAAYSLFPDLPEFHSGRIVRDEEGRYRLEWVTRAGGGTKSREISSTAFELTRAHVGFVERNRTLEAEDVDPEVEARVLYRMAMPYSAERRYDVVSSLLDDLRTKHAEVDRPATGR